MSTKIEISEEQISEVFIKWYQQYKQNPEMFDLMDSLSSDLDYGKYCAEYFIKLFIEK